MSKSFTLNQLTEGIRQRHLGAQNRRLVEKWSRTGLLRGLEDQKRENMAMMLENQAAQLLREQNSISTGAASGTSSGDIRGFTNIAFPIVRRVFAGLVSNELVSIQPMSLPSGLLFYLDYTYGTNVGGDSSLTAGTRTKAATYKKGDSIYNSPPGKGIRSGSLASGGQYDLVGSTYSKVHSQSLVNASAFRASGSWQGSANALVGGQMAHATGTDGKMLQFDPQVTNLIENEDGVWSFFLFNLSVSAFNNADLTSAQDISFWTVGNNTSNNAGMAILSGAFQGGAAILNLRRLNQVGTYDGARFTPNPLISRTLSTATLLTVMSGKHSPGTTVASGNPNLSCSYALPATLNIDSNDGSALTIPSFESNFATSPSPIIPEIDIKIESIAVTAVTRKLRARWSPELAQDLNAYHSMDAEVELTQILSEQVALELDREILNDLLTEANGANLYWSRAPGKFVNKENGTEVTLASSLATGPQFTGTVREWYETLVETVIDVANQIHRKTLRGSANFVVTSPDVSTIFEASVLYKPNYSLDGQGQVSNPFSLGAAPVGTLSNRFTVYKDPYFPRNKILVGYKGGSYLETGYVYAPYVPLIVTPTIFAPEDFTPRKGVMTRYGKKMVRSDFYGTVTVMDLNII